MKVYIAGPMTGIEEFNYPAFHAAAAAWRNAGYEVISPAEINTDTTLSWEECIRRDLAKLVECDAIALLPGWENSRGANLELHVAKALSMPTFNAIVGDRLED